MLAYSHNNTYKVVHIFTTSLFCMLYRAIQVVENTKELHITHAKNIKREWIKKLERETGTNVNVDLYVAV